MATLILDWPTTDGSGTDVDEIVANPEMPLYWHSANSYPVWESGIEGGAGKAVKYSGSISSGAYAATDDPIACDLSSVGITVAIVFKAPSSDAPSVLLKADTDVYVSAPLEGSPYDAFAAIGAPTHLVYIGTDNKLYFSWQSQTLSNRTTNIQAAAVNNDDWHVAIAKTITAKTGKIYLDGAWYSTALNSNGTAADASYFMDSGFYTSYWAVGGGNIAGGLGFYAAPSSRSFNGSIGRCKVYCGQLTDDEIEDLYNELLAPPVANALMFSCNT